MPGKINILIADPVNLTGVSFLNRNKFRIKVKYNLIDDEITGFSRSNNIRVLVINSRRKINRCFLSRNNYTAIATASRGTEHIDTAYAKKRNTGVINSVSGNAVSAAEHTMAMILALYKNLLAADKTVRHGNFDSRNIKSRNLNSRKIGIIGFGQIGSRVGMLARCFGMDVVFNDIDENVIKSNRMFEFSDINSIFRYCDVVTVHIPLNKNNLSFIRLSHLSLMQKRAVFINTSRGAVVCEKELLDFLKRRPDVASGLDVFCNEPDINPDFKSLENVILSNHIAGKSEESGKSISAEIFMQVNNMFF